MANLIITCEHGGNDVPEIYRGLFPASCPELGTHRGCDIGALKLAKHLAEQLTAPLFYNQVTRLLIDFNRSIGHKSLFSEFSKNLSEKQKQQLINDYYLPYRRNIKQTAQALSPVIHLSVHSFTPELDGRVRDVDIGLLYDPKRQAEKELAHRWKQSLPKTYRTRMNKPYLGISDGLVPALRKELPPSEYAGIELEVNQQILTISKQADEVKKALADSLKKVL